LKLKVRWPRGSHL